jgi:hypothetical protein
MYLTIIFVLILFFSTSKAQIFNSAHITKNKQFTFSVNPVLLDGIKNDDAGLFLHGDYGVGNNMQLAAKLGVGLNDTYFGISLEKLLVKTYPLISLSGGLHSFGDTGLDLTLNTSVPLNKLVVLYGGLDFDVVFAEKRQFHVQSGKWKNESDTNFLSWFFMGTEIVVRNNMTFLFEAEIGIAEDAYNLLGAGVKFYF